jgi:hypothetical protein
MYGQQKVFMEVFSGVSQYLLAMIWMIFYRLSFTHIYFIFGIQRVGILHHYVLQHGQVRFTIRYSIIGSSVLALYRN